MTKIFAHRGASGYAPENTLPAFAMAEKQGADGIELDVQLTKDGELVVIHDEKIDRTSTGKGFVRDYTLPELRKMSFCNHMELYSGVKIPTLEEDLDLVKPGNMTVNIELKTGIFWYQGIVEKTWQDVHITHEGNLFQNFDSYGCFDDYLPQEGQDFDCMPYLTMSQVKELSAAQAVFYNNKEPKEYRGK